MTNFPATIARFATQDAGRRTQDGGPAISARTRYARFATQDAGRRTQDGGPAISARTRYARFETQYAGRRTQDGGPVISARTSYARFATQDAGRRTQDDYLVRESSQEKDRFYSRYHTSHNRQFRLRFSKFTQWIAGFDDAGAGE